MALGFKDRQTISAIETGERKVTPEELLSAVQYFGKPLEFFIDPYVVAEKATFSYRASTLQPAALTAFEDQAERLISAQRRFRKLLGDTASPVHAQLPDITKATALNLASRRGEQLANAWQLGEVPAQKLREAAELRMNVTVFFVDAPSGISGAACYLSDGGVVLINRNESLGRRNFNLGHELFHLLTWNQLEPDRMDFENEQVPPRSRVEQLADAFTGGLLMPTAVIEPRWLARGTQEIEAWLRDNAAVLQVSPIALYWRLFNLGFVGRDVKPPKAVGTSRRGETPKLYNSSFVEQLQQVLARGHITMLKAIQLLDCSPEELGALFRTYNLAVPFEI